MSARYVPGTATLVVRDESVLLVDRDPGHLELDALTALEPAVVLGSFLAAGLGSVPDFALVEISQDLLRILVRGVWQVEVDGSVHEAPDAVTWAEVSVAAGPRAHVTVRRRTSPTPSDATVADLPIANGVVLADAVRTATPVEPSARTAGGEASGARATQDAVPGARPDPSELPIVPTAVPTRAPSRRAAQDPAITRTELPTPTSGAEHLGDDLDDLFELTSAQRARTDDEAAPLPPAPVPPGPAPGPTPGDVVGGIATADPLGSDGAGSSRLGDHDDETVAGAGLVQLLRDRDARREAAAVPAHTEVVARILVGGVWHDVRATTVLGRRPQARNTLGAPPRLIPVPSPQSVVSGTHLELTLEDSHLLVRDVSSNGTLLRRPGSPEPQRLPSGEAVVLTDGSHLDLGDGVHVEVEVEVSTR